MQKKATNPYALPLIPIHPPEKENERTRRSNSEHDFTVILSTALAVVSDPGQLDVTPDT